MISYTQELTSAMAMLARQPRTIIMGQAVAYPGTFMTRTFRDCPRQRLFEMPVAEDMQMGMAIGCSLAGEIPICCYPRINFLLLAINQLVLHLDKLPIYSRGGWNPKVIIRTAIANTYPLHPGAQHIGDYTSGIRRMVDQINVVTLTDAAQIQTEYKRAYRSARSTILVEYMSKYDDGV